MRKMIAMLLALLLAASLPAFALTGGPIGSISGPDGVLFGSAPIGDSAGESGDGTVEYKPLVCEELGFSTLTAPSLDGYYAEGGFYIDLGSNDDSPWVMIAYAEGGSNDEAANRNYIQNVFAPSLCDEVDGDLIQTDPVNWYTIAGVEMLGAMFTYQLNGRDRTCFCLRQLRDDGFVEYQARYYADDSQDCLAVLCIAAHYFQPDPYYYTGGSPAPVSEPEPAPDATQTQANAAPGTYDGRTIVSVPQQGFSTLTSTNVGWEYVEGEGALIYTQERDVIPFVQLYVLNEPLEDLHDFIDRGLTPYMQQQYGNDLLSVRELGDTTLAGRNVVGAIYDYRVQGYVIEIYRVYENRNGRTVMYVAKYLQGEGDATMAALEEAVGFFQEDADYYASAAAAPAAVEGGSSDRLPGGGQTDPLPQPEQVQKPDLGSLIPINCREMDFSIATDPSNTWEFSESNGLTIYTEGNEKGIPYVLVYREDHILPDPAAYIRDKETPAMQRDYGDDLVGYVEYEYYTIGGKDLPAAKYTYRLQGFMIDMLRLYDTVGDHTVTFTAKYIQGDDAGTLAALDAAVRYYQPQADYYN